MPKPCQHELSRFDRVVLPRCPKSSIAFIIFGLSHDYIRVCCKCWSGLRSKSRGEKSRGNFEKLRLQLDLAVLFTGDTAIFRNSCTVVIAGVYIIPSNMAPISSAIDLRYYLVLYSLYRIGMVLVLLPCTNSVTWPTLHRDPYRINEPRQHQTSLGSLGNPVHQGNRKNRPCTKFDVNPTSQGPYSNTKPHLGNHVRGIVTILLI